MFKKLRLTVFFCIMLATSYVFADTDLEQVKANIISLIQQTNYAEAQAQTQQLLTDFPEHEDIARSVWQIAKTYDDAKEYDRAFELNQYNITHFSNDANVVLSQVEIVKFHFRNGDNAAVDASVDDFLAAFSDKPALPKGIYHIARRYDEFKRYDKAVELHQYNVEHFPDDIYAMWSQVEIIYLNIRNKDDAAVNTAVDNLLTVFAEQPTLSQEIYQIAKRFNELERYDQAVQLNQHNVEHYPDDIHALWSQVEIVFHYIREGDNDAIDTAFNKLLFEFSGQPTLTNEIYHIARRCNEFKRYDKAIELDQYNVEHFPDNIHAMWSQVEVVFHHIREADYAADTAFNKLITEFSGQPYLPKEIYLIADRLSEAGNSERAVELYQSLIDRGTTTSDIYLRQFAVLSYFALGDNEAGQMQLDKLTVDFNDHENLPQVLSNQIAEQFYNKALQLEGKGLAAPARDYFQRAVDMWEQVGASHTEVTNTADGYSWAGHCYRKLGKYEKAIDCYSNVAEKFPWHDLAWNSLLLVGRCYEDMQQSGAISETEAKSKIRVAYEQLVEKYPDCKAAKIAQSWLDKNKERKDKIFL